MCYSLNACVVLLGRFVSVTTNIQLGQNVISLLGKVLAMKYPVKVMACQKTAYRTVLGIDP